MANRSLWRVRSHHCGQRSNVLMWMLVVLYVPASVSSLVEVKVADIFVSYARDDQATILKFIEVFEQRGWTCWHDRKTPAGAEWQSFISTQLLCAGCVFVVWSIKSTKSEFVLDEVREANDAQIPVVPAVLDESRPPKPFCDVHAADLSDWSGQHDDKSLNGLLQSIEDSIEPPNIFVLDELACHGLGLTRKQLGDLSGKRLALVQSCLETALDLGWARSIGTGKDRRFQMNTNGMRATRELLRSDSMRRWRKNWAERQ